MCHLCYVVETSVGSSFFDSVSDVYFVSQSAELLHLLQKAEIAEQDGKVCELSSL